MAVNIVNLQNLEMMTYAKMLYDREPFLITVFFLLSVYNTTVLIPF